MVGRPRTYAMREIVNAILYLVRTGCQWRNLPHDFPPYGLVLWYFRRLRDTGTLQAVHDSLRTKVRKQAGKEPTPSVLLLDSQSVKTTEKGAQPNLRKRSGMTRARTSKAASVT